ncbi:MAG: hypothetical protein IIT65_11625, partial [Lachnospiraceae bacterium]|nr:hypothetical protein [Lachnospiraceae bacterium]
CIKRRDINYKLNFQNVKDLIADAKCLVDKIKEKGVISFADMSNASYLNISEAQKMQEDFKKGCDYLWRNQAELKKGVDYISQYAEYKNDKLAEKRFEHGLALVGGAVLGIKLVISTAGAGAPLVLTTIAGACDVGLACEGVQETYYGAIKDIETPSINPVRDYICMGNQEAYDMLSMLSHNMCFVSASINTIVSAGSGGTVGSTTLKEVVQIRTCAEIVTVNVAAPVGNYYIGKYATSCTDNELLQFGIQVGGNLLLGAAIKGVAHINGMGAQKLASKYYLTEIIGKMKAMLLSMEEARNDPFNAEDGVMDLLPDRILKLLWAYQDPLENEKVRLKNLRDGIATYDADFKANKFQNIRELLAESERLVNLIKEKGIVTFEGMNPADYFTDEQYEKILVNISDSYTYLLENKDNILNDTQFVVDYVIKVEEREKNEAKKHRIEKGIILILTGSMAIGSIIATAGTSGPLIAELAWTAGATYIGADSTAKTIEGIQEIYYGLNNDFETQSFNGVRDGVFRGNQKYYDLANLIIYSGFTCTCSYKNIYTAGTEALKNGGS